jgi:hypothetical protein
MGTGQKDNLTFAVSVAPLEIAVYVVLIPADILLLCWLLALLRVVPFDIINPRLLCGALACLCNLLPFVGARLVSITTAFACTSSPPLSDGKSTHICS